MSRLMPLSSLYVKYEAKASKQLDWKQEETANPCLSYYTNI